MIGIVGGVGPQAGLDLARKVIDQTLAAADQQHLPLALLSLPGQIPDRTEFLLGRSLDNPGEAISRVILALEGLGAEVIGIPCNTAHAPAIFEVIRDRLAEAAGRPSTDGPRGRVQILHMIEEVARFLAEQFPHVRRVGVLATTGTVRSGVYPSILGGRGFQVLSPDEAGQQAVHDAIYNAEYGIKAQADPVTGKATQALFEAIEYLRQQGAEAIVLGCSEIPLAVSTAHIGLAPSDGSSPLGDLKTPIIDANLVLARALVREAAPEKLRPYRP